MVAMCPQRQGLQRRHTEQGPIQTEGQPLSGTRCNAQAGEGARPATIGDGIELGRRHPCFIEHLVDHRQQAAGMRPGSKLETRDHLVRMIILAAQQGGGAGARGSVQGEQDRHGKYASMENGRTLYDNSPRDAGCRRSSVTQLEGLDHLGGDVIDATHALDAMVAGRHVGFLPRPVLIVLDQRRRLVVIHRQPVAHRASLSSSR